MTITCGNCGTTYPIIDGVPAFVENVKEHSESLEQAKRGREEWYEATQNVAPEQDMWFHLMRMADSLLRELYERHVAPDKEIIDLGCGDGRNSVFLRTVGARVVGTDYNLVRVRRANDIADRYDELFMSDLLRLPFPDKYCEVIHFDQVLEHIPQPERALASIRRVLRDDGILVLGVPNEGCWYHQLKFRIKPSLLQKTDHVNFFTLRTATELLGKCGFEVREAKGMGWGLPALGHGPLLRWITQLEDRLRRRIWYNWMWETFGRLLLPGQYFLLYLVASKAGAQRVGGTRQ